MATIRISLCVLLGMVSLVVPSLAADWKPLGLQGVDILSLHAVPGAVYAGTTEVGIFRLDTADPASTWTPVGPSGATIVSLWADSERTGLVFAVGAGGRLFRTVDGGGSWDDLTSLAGAATIRVVHGRKGKDGIYIGGDGLWVSRDEGDSWQQVTIFDIHALEVDPIFNNVIWIGERSVVNSIAGLLMSRSGGRSWQYVGPLAGSGPLDVATSPLYKDVTLVGQAGSILRVSNLGHLVIFKNLGEPAGFRLDWDHVVSQRAYAAGSSPAGGRAYETRDTGFTWTDITGNLASRQVHAVRTDALAAGAVYAGTDDGVYRLGD